MDNNQISKSEQVKALKVKAKTANSETERKKVIAAFYDIIRSGAEVKVFNEDLKKDICITSKTTKETIAHASRARKSTLVVFELLNILKNAKKVSEEAIKSSSKNQKDDNIKR
jgi:hypothetical protein